VLGLSLRHVRRILAAYRKEGAAALAPFFILMPLVIGKEVGIATNSLLHHLNECPSQPLITRLGNPAVKDLASRDIDRWH